jgi:hypothetical protein
MTCPARKNKVFKYGVGVLPILDWFRYAKLWAQEYVSEVEVDNFVTSSI